MAHAAVVTAAVLFGSTFVVVKDAVRHARPVPFLAARFLIGAAVLAVVDRVRSRRRAPRALAAGVAAGPAPAPAPGLVRAGALAGVALLGGYVTQTIGLQTITTSVSAFLTYLLVVMVPVLAAVWLRRPPGASAVVGVAMSVAGLWLLTGRRFALGRGELLTLGCAVCFAVNIILLSSAAPRFDTIRLNAVQLLVVGGGCLLPGLWAGGYGFGWSAWLAAAYTGVMASAVALGLQVWGQRVVGPTRTSLLLLIEPVSAAVIGVMIGEHLGWAGAAGAGLILAGILAAEVGPILAARRVRPTRPRPARG